MENVSNITEQRYMEMAEDFKAIMIEKDNELKKIKKEINKFKVVMFRIFGIMSFCEDIVNEYDLDNASDYEQTLFHNIEYVNCQIQKLFEL